MRICRNDIRLIKPGELRNNEPEKKQKKPLTAAQKRRIAELKKRVEDENRAKLNPIPKGAETRG